MDAMVTARVPVEIKEQVSALLKSNGSSPTELINSAFEYYLEYQTLPMSDKLTAGVRRLDAAQAQQVSDTLSRLSIDY